MTQRSFFLKSQPGQAGLLAIAVSIVLALVLGSATLSSISNLDAQRNIVDRRSMQAYYVAQAGIQEALATRMLPRSNYLNFYSPPGTPKPVLPYFNNSGLVFQKPIVNATAGTDQKLLGVYRYIIVGGDPSRKPDGSYYGIPPGPPFSAANGNVTNNSTPTPRLVTFQSNPPSSPFYVISNGITCIKDKGTNGGDQGINQIMGSTAFITSARQLTLTNGGQAQCKAGYTAQEATLVAQVSIEQESGALDKVDSVRMFPDRTKVTLPGNCFVPGMGWTNAGTPVNFDNTWGSQSSAAGRTPARPMRIVFFKFGTNQVYQSVDLSSGGTINIPQAVPADASMMLYFDGPIDYRSLSNSDWTGNSTWFYDKDLTGCKLGNAYSCVVRLYQNITNPWYPLYTGLKVVPILPYSTKVLLLAPLGGNLVNGGQSYHMDLGGQVAGATFRSFSYAPASSGVVVYFSTK